MGINYPRVILAGTHSGAGKTTLALGIMLDLRKKGAIVQPFKAGPDYIDPGYHTEVTNRVSCNLDSWLLSEDAILELFQRRAKDADISIIEGVMGLYDGARDSEKGSTAHLAKILNCPVILILDARSLSRSAGAIVLGYREFDRKVKIKGIILNNIGSKNHYHLVKNAVESKTRIEVLGYLPKNSNLKLPERHLGLVPAQERKLYKVFRRELLTAVKANIDIENILKISREAQALPYIKKTVFNLKKPVKKYIRVAVARDKAFNFYYQDNLDILMHLGAKIVTFSPLRDRELPGCIDGLYIGGGFPELFALSLSKNKRLKGLIYQKAEEGLPIYAECGGLMYLMERVIDFKKRAFPMAGIFRGSVSMADKLQGLGYVTIHVIKDNILSKTGDKNRAHIFHWSYLKDIPGDTSFAYKITRPEGGASNSRNADYDGLVKGNVLASYVHLHFASNLNFARNFIKNCEGYRAQKYG